MTLEQLQAIVAAQQTWINSVISNSRLPSELASQSTVGSTDVLLIQRDVDEVKQIDAEIVFSLLKVETFVATHGQTTFTVSEAIIVDDGLWSVQVGSALLNSTTGITSFVNGSISINFATGEITFLNPLQGGTQVLIKYN